MSILVFLFIFFFSRPQCWKKKRNRSEKLVIRMEGSVRNHGQKGELNNIWKELKIGNRTTCVPKKKNVC